MTTTTRYDSRNSSDIFSISRMFNRNSFMRASIAHRRMSDGALSVAGNVAIIH
ncbi:MAG TPA: hypothetical protein VJH33_03745 [Candidatus Paceibacterota bacterium]